MAFRRSAVRLRSAPLRPNRWRHRNTLHDEASSAGPGLRPLSPVPCTVAIAPCGHACHGSKSLTLLLISVGSDCLNQQRLTRSICTWEEPIRSSAQKLPSPNISEFATLEMQGGRSVIRRCERMANGVLRACGILRTGNISAELATAYEGNGRAETDWEER